MLRARRGDDLGRSADRVAALLERDVTFHACRNAMDVQDVSTDDLVNGAETVPSGVGGLASLEAEGYLYIKVP